MPILHNHKQLKVCFYLDTLNLGGIERVTLNLADEFIKSEIDVDLFLTRLSGEHVSQIPNRVRVFQANSRVRNIIPLFRYLRTQKPKVLITSHLHISIISILLCKLTRMPVTVVVTVHIHFSRVHRSNNYFRGLIIKLIATFIYPLADRIIAVSRAVADDLSRFIGMPRHSIDVIYNPVVNQKLLADAKKKQNHLWFKTNAVPIVIGSGRLTEQKDFHTLIRAFAKVRSSINAKLMILGEGEDRHSLENLIVKLNLEQDVALLGYVGNPYSYMARASVFVLSSIWEGLPTVLIEALSLGTPVIATDCPGGTKEVLDNGKYGILVPVGNSDQIALAILDILYHPPDKEMLKKRGMEFSSKKCASQYLHLLEFR